MAHILFLILALVGSLWASFSDIRERIIPNRLTLTLFSIGFAGNSIYSFFIRDYLIFSQMVMGLVIIFIVGFLFWKIGGWGAADAKMFLFIGALVPVYPGYLIPFFSPVLGDYPFILTVFLNTMMTIFPFIIIYAMATAYRNMDFKILIPTISDIKDFTVSSTVITAAMTISVASGLWYSGLIYLFFTLFFPNWKNKFFLSLSIIILLALQGGGAELDLILRYFLLFFTIFFMLRFSFRLVNLVRKSLRIQVPITELKEGDIVADRIYKDGERIYSDSRGILDLIKEGISTGNLDIIKIGRRETIVNTTAAGLEMEEIERLNSLVRGNLLEDRIQIRKSSPFAPAIFLGFLISLTTGDLFVILKGILYG